MAKALAHPLRSRVLVRLQEGPASPNEISQEFGEPLGNVSYHVKTLLQLGCIELVDTAIRRGAIEHYYRAITASALPDIVRTLPLSVRTALSASVASEIVTRVAAALKADTFGDPANKPLESHRLVLDEAGWAELASAVAAIATRARELEADTEKRGGGQARELALLLFPTAP
jgi:DNA-binding transcriptional ArsR family regulator